MKKKVAETKFSLRLAGAYNTDFRLIFFAFVVGLVAGLVGSFFRLILEQIDLWRSSVFVLTKADGGMHWVFAIALAVVGVTVALFMVKRWAPEASGSGVHEIEGALDEVRVLRWKRIIPVKFIASLFSLGSGLLLGREGPTIQLGANIGKMVKDVFKLPEEHDNPLISSGAAAGLACAFNAPFSGIVFVLEEMHGHFKFSFYSVAAIMVASATADIVVRLLIGVDPVIRMMVFGQQALSTLWLYMVLGLVLSVLGFLFNRLLVFSLDVFTPLVNKSLLASGLVIGTTIAVIGIWFPELIGGGYTTVAESLEFTFGVKMLLIILVARFFLTLFSYGSGVPGGIFAPLLALGVLSGMAYGFMAQHFFPDLVDNPAVFAVAGMAGVFAATVRAPLTGIALAIEMTSNYELILPLIITTLVSSVVTSQLGNQPIYTTLLKRTLAQA
ncbi:MAG: H(+)/Cl(-) exchange transporter ClcA [Bacteroidales bacterium]|nr:H(+)/Cl(-) exchange transporter ClcA [Bacteroidales bacterium]